MEKEEHPQEQQQQEQLVTDNTAPIKQESSKQEPSSSLFSASRISTWARSLKIPQGETLGSDSPTGKSTAFSRLTSSLSGLRLSPRSSAQQQQPPPQQLDADGGGVGNSGTQSGVFGSLTRGLVDSSKNAVKAVQVKARHMVSQNKRRYQEGGFDLDMTYITENIIAMGFPAGDMSSGFFGYVEGFYRNHMEEVIKFFETYHKGKYKVYNLCSERLYDASLFEGKVASFPFDDHNCPPIQLIILFCQSAYSWLKQDIENVVVVHCKAGMARTGLMISSLLLFLKFFPTAEESIEYYNQKRCIDGKGLVLPSQIRYVKYFERILTYFNGENQPDRSCMLRGFRLHKCPYWIRPSMTVSNHDGVLFSTKKHPRTKDLMPEDFWFSAPKKGIMVFALPGEPGLTEVAGDFKIHFHDRQGDFYCWLNTTMMENRTTLSTADLDGFDKRKLPSPGFQVEVVLVDVDSSTANKKRETSSSSSSDATSAAAQDGSGSGTSENTITTTDNKVPPTRKKEDSSQDKDDVFSDNESEGSGAPRKKATSKSGTGIGTGTGTGAANADKETANAEIAIEKITLKNDGKSTSETTKSDIVEPSSTMSEFKAIAADASVFSFGDEEEDYESE